MSGRTQAYAATTPRFQASSAGANGRVDRLLSMPRPHDPTYNRDDEHKAGRPQRMAQEPRGAKDSVRSSKTRTDPASGEPAAGGAAPNQADADQDT